MAESNLNVMASLFSPNSKADQLSDPRRKPPDLTETVYERGKETSLASSERYVITTLLSV